jgi:hypothetical protein
MGSGLESGFESKNVNGARRQAARQASSRESCRRQPSEEAPGQTAAVVENDASGHDLAIWKHSNLIAHEAFKRDMRLPPPSLPRQRRSKKAQDGEPCAFRQN